MFLLISVKSYLAFVVDATLLTDSVDCFSSAWAVREWSATRTPVLVLCAVYCSSCAQSS